MYLVHLKYLPDIRWDCFPGTNMKYGLTPVGYQSQWTVLIEFDTSNTVNHPVALTQSVTLSNIEKLWSSVLLLKMENTIFILTVTPILRTAKGFEKWSPNGDRVGHLPLESNISTWSKIAYLKTKVDMLFLQSSTDKILYSRKVMVQGSRWKCMHMEMFFCFWFLFCNLIHFFLLR